MLSIRFSKIGKRGRPELRLIVVDRRKDPWGRAVEILGFRNPRTKENVFNLDRVKHWLDKGARPSATVHNLLIDLKLIEGKKQTVTSLTKKRRNKMAKQTEKAV